MFTKLYEHSTLLNFLMCPFSYGFLFILTCGQFIDGFELVVKTGRPMFFGRKMEEELSKELELQIKGAEKPFIWKLIGVRTVLLPLVCRLIKTGLSMFFECSLMT